jgi:ribosome-associated heat shock protein Hsp15
MGAPRVRLDKWLWAARFFKTRSIAAHAVEGGRVQLNGERTKPAKPVKVRDRLSVRNGPYLWELTVVVLSERRGSAAEAQKLYVEEEASRRAREETLNQLRAERLAGAVFKGRPTKRQRRQIAKLTQELD